MNKRENARYTLPRAQSEQHNEYFQAEKIEKVPKEDERK